jgi:3-oxoacyl-[acyl-carrier protein] reductase
MSGLEEGASTMLLKGKNAIITGCAKGIGRSIVETFAKNGANIWACARKQSNDFEEYTSNLAKEYGVHISPVYFDLVDSEQMKAGVRLIASSKQRIDILVNNAGATHNALFLMTTREKLLQMFEVNFFSQYVFTQYIVKLMLRGKCGSIVNIASTAALDGNPGRSAYGASKAAVICTTKALAAELAEHGIRANAIAPGITDTDMVEQSMTEHIVCETVEQTSLRRMAKPVEIANAALFLASELSSYVTGQVIRVDGGM